MQSAASTVSGNRLLAGAMEVVLLVMAAVGPWLYGAVHPGFELLLHLGLAILMGLWALKMLCERQFVVARCPTTLMLALLVLLGLLQLTPLPDGLLRLLSPATADLYDYLLPSQPETPPLADAAVTFPARTLSLCPAATRSYCARLLAVLLLFVVVRNNLGGVGPFMRFAVVMAVNGFALCLFGIVQYLTSSHSLLYWTNPSLGQVFGPFVSRNMFPYVANVSIGLTLGLLWARRVSQRRGSDAHRRSRARGWRGFRDDLHQIIGEGLQDSPTLWLAAAAAFMVSTVAFTLSRGGALALAGGLAVGFLAARGRRGRLADLVGPLLFGGLAVFFLIWLGLPLVESRFRTLWSPDQADTARLPCWRRVLPGVAEFPLFGTGLGTFQYVEVWRRGDTPIDPAAPPGVPQPLEAALFDHAHNDYVEIVVEAGLPGLLLVMGILFFVCRAGFRTISRHAGGRRAGLAAGGLCAVTAVAVHSVVDFGMHAPAIAMLTTVVCALLIAQDSESTKDAEPAAWRVSLGGLAPLAGGATLVLLAAMICAHTWKAHRVERLRAAAARVPENAPERQRLRLSYLEAAARLAPDDPVCRFEMVGARLRFLQDELARIDAARAGVAADAAAVVPSLIGPMAAGFSVVVLSTSWDAHWIARAEMANLARETARRRHIDQALTHCLAARNACPLMAEPHFTLGLYGHVLPKAESPRNYFKRVMALTPRMPDVWYYSGLDHLTRGKPDLAWKHWQRYLALADRYLDPILSRAVPMLKADDLIAKVLPDRPEVILKAGLRTRIWFRFKGGQQRFWQAALESCKRQPLPLPVVQQFTMARLQMQLGLSEQARQTFRQALARQPSNDEARLELASVCFNLKDFREAAREADAVLSNQPQNAAAKALRDDAGKLLDSQRLTFTSFTSFPNSVWERIFGNSVSIR